MEATSVNSFVGPLVHLTQKELAGIGPNNKPKVLVASGIWGLLAKPYHF